MTDTVKKRVIISGANGYFGGIACRFFQAKGWQVVKAMRCAGFDLFFDLDQPAEFAHLSLNGGADLFIHAAAAHEVACLEQPYQSVIQNVVGTKAALDFCLANNINKFIYISTFHVFGRPSGEINELCLPLPANDYGLSHFQAEEYVRMYSREKRITGSVVRPTNFFGIPADIGQCKRWTLVPLEFCREAVQNGKIVLRTPGYQMRNFIAVGDICAAIESAFPVLGELPLLHIPGPNTMMIRTLALLVQQCIQTQLGKKVELVVPEGNPIDDCWQYSSLYLNNIYKPSERIEAFISGFCKELSSY